jgi:hypothetical protein
MTAQVSLSQLDPSTFRTIEPHDGAMIALNVGPTVVDDEFLRAHKAIFVVSQKDSSVLVLVEKGDKFIVLGPREVYFQKNDGFGQMCVVGGFASLPADCAFEGGKMTSGPLVIGNNRQYSVLKWWRLERESTEQVLRLVHNVLVAAPAFDYVLFTVENGRVVKTEIKWSTQDPTALETQVRRYFESVRDRVLEQFGAGNVSVLVTADFIKVFRTAVDAQAFAAQHNIHPGDFVLFFPGDEHLADLCLSS